MSLYWCRTDPPDQAAPRTVLGGCDGPGEDHQRAPGLVWALAGQHGVPVLGFVPADVGSLPGSVRAHRYASIAVLSGAAASEEGTDDRHRGNASRPA